MQKLKLFLKTKKSLLVEVLILAALVYKGLGYPIQNFKSCQHFVYLAEAFLKGHFYIEKEFPCFYDVILKEGKIFLPFGPMPAILLMVQVAIFGREINEVWLSVLAMLACGYLAGQISQQLGVKNILDRIWLMVMFIFGSLYFIYWHWEGPWAVAHAVAVALTMLAIERGLRKKCFEAGLFLGMAFLTRSPIIFGAIFFLVFWYARKETLGTYLEHVLLFSLGLLGPLFFFFWYNGGRFGNILESGYSLTILGTPVLEQAHEVGLFSLAHVPKNLYAMLLMGLEAFPSLESPILQPPYFRFNPWGMSLFLSTPALIYIFSAKIKEKVNLAAWLAVILICLPILTYYGVGYAQFGYRYALDFFPFLFILTVMGTKDNFGFWPKVLIVLGVWLNTSLV